MRRDHRERRQAHPARGRLRAGVPAHLSRFLVYGVLGLATELAFTAATSRRPRTSLWMLPVYGLARPLFEPAHDRLRGRSVPARAAAYGIGFAAVEYASGRVLRRLRGDAPWDYSHARLHLHGLVRADYVPLWGAAGLALERVHDRLAAKSGFRPST